MAARVAAAIEGALGVPVGIEPGDRGEFSVWVGEARVARKTLDGFPSVEDCVAAVARAAEER
jgi:hypothetical protein